MCHRTTGVIKIRKVVIGTINPSERNWFGSVVHWATTLNCSFVPKDSSLFISNRLRSLIGPVCFAMDAINWLVDQILVAQWWRPLLRIIPAVSFYSRDNAVNRSSVCGQHRRRDHQSLTVGRVWTSEAKEGAIWGGLIGRLCFRTLITANSDDTGPSSQEIVLPYCVLDLV